MNTTIFDIFIKLGQSFIDSGSLFGIIIGIFLVVFGHILVTICHVLYWGIKVLRVFLDESLYYAFHGQKNLERGKLQCVQILYFVSYSLQEYSKLSVSLDLDIEKKPEMSLQIIIKMVKDLLKSFFFNLISIVIIIISIYWILSYFQILMTTITYIISYFTIPFTFLIVIKNWLNGLDLYVQTKFGIHILDIRIEWIMRCVTFAAIIVVRKFRITKVDKAYFEKTGQQENTKLFKILYELPAKERRAHLFFISLIVLIAIILIYIWKPIISFFQSLG